MSPGTGGWTSERLSILGASQERALLYAKLEEKRKLRNALIRRLIIDEDRIDLLATILKLEVVPTIHLPLMRHQLSMKETLTLIFRGAGKSKIGTETKAIHLVLKNRDVSILLVSKTAENAKKFLGVIKGHFERNELLREIFGDYVGNEKWADDAIIVSDTKEMKKEATIQCMGVLGAVVSGHYDVIIGDDLVDEDNSRTPYRREQLKTWYYKSLMPTLNPPTEKNPGAGQIHLLGTRYHYADLYGHLIENEMKDSTLIIPALRKREIPKEIVIDEMEGVAEAALSEAEKSKTAKPRTRMDITFVEESPWPERYSAEFFQKKREKMGSIIFNSQFQCDTALMKGAIFDYDYFEEYSLIDLDADWPIFMGVDLAIKQSEEADCFAIVVLALNPANGFIYCIDFLEKKLTFTQQVNKVLEFAARYNPRRIGIETNAYQDALVQVLKERPEGRGLPIMSINTQVDKITRANKLSARFEARQVRFLKGEAHRLIIDHLVLFPGGDYKDLFDAFDFAVTASQGKKGAPRRAYEPGLL